MSFQFIPVSDQQKALMQVYRDRYEALANEIKQLDKSRGTALAVTKLEESAMWLNKAITGNDQL